MISTEKLYAVNTISVRPIETLAVVHESTNMYLLENKVMVSKKHMGDSAYLYFTDLPLAETVASYIKMSAYAQPPVTNMKAILNCTNPTSLAVILFDMIQKLCEEGMPTHAEIENWLSTPTETPRTNDNIDTYELEEYDSIKEGDMVYCVEDGEVLLGKVFGVHYKKDRISSVSVEVPNDFLGIAGSQFGKTLFLRKTVAEFMAKN